MDINEIEADDAFDLMQDNDAKFIDVRTKEEFDQGCAEDAVLIPIYFNQDDKRILNDNFLQQVNSLFSKDTPLIVGCKVGNRSIDACEKLISDGFTQVYNLTGGFYGNNQAQGWQQLGLPTD